MITVLKYVNGWDVYIYIIKMGGRKKTIVM